jgi:hypothetical protein
VSGTPSLPRPPRQTNYRAALITLLCSFLLGAGSCVGFLTTLNFNHGSAISTAFAAGFGLCVLVFLGSVVWLVVQAIRGRRGDAGAG